MTGFESISPHTLTMILTLLLRSCIGYSHETITLENLKRRNTSRISQSWQRVYWLVLDS